MIGSGVFLSAQCNTSCETARISGAGAAAAPSCLNGAVSFASHARHVPLFIALEGGLRCPVSLQPQGGLLGGTQLRVGRASNENFGSIVFCAAPLLRDEIGNRIDSELKRAF